MVSVLFGPGERPFTDSGYARTYNLLSALDTTEVSPTVVVGNADVGVANTVIDSITADGHLKYRIEAWRRLYEYLHSDSFDVYQHVNMNHPHYNPLLLSGAVDDTPTILGPAEGGHTVPPDSYKLFLDHLVGFDVPQSVSDLLYTGSKPLLGGINRVREWLFSRTARRADIVVAVSTDVARLYQQYAPGTRIEVIPYGVDLGRYEYTPRSESHELLVVGDLLSRKGHEYLIEALPDIRETVADTTLHIVGTGAMAADLKALVDDLDLGEAVTFHGYVSEEKLVSLYERAQVFVHPSLSEGYSHVRLEAMATGCPVIGTPVSGFEDTVTDGRDGFVVPKRSPDAIADAVRELFSTPGRATEMGRRARECIEERHDWDHVAAQYTELYEELA
jgi:glycosyltransferase involved in cell wall biosynthesis